MMVAVIKLAWLLGSAASLLSFFFLYDGQANSGMEIIVAYFMAILSFTSGPFVIIIVSSIDNSVFELTRSERGDAYLPTFAMWLVFFVVGYVQWFLGVPRAWAAMRAPPPG